MKLQSIIVDSLRRTSERIVKLYGPKSLHFPELMPDHTEQEAAIVRAASMIAKHGNQDKGHKIAAADLAALVHYIGDMIASDE